MSEADWREKEGSQTGVRGWNNGKKEEYYFYLNAFTQILDPFVIKEINIIECNSFEKAFIIN